MKEIVWEKGLQFYGGKLYKNSPLFHVLEVSSGLINDLYFFGFKFCYGFLKAHSYKNKLAKLIYTSTPVYNSGCHPSNFTDD